jgi:exosortase
VRAKLLNSLSPQTLASSSPAGVLRAASSPAAVVMLLVVAASLANAMAWAPLLALWLDPESRYAHGLLLALVVLVVLFRRLPVSAEPSSAAACAAATAAVAALSAVAATASFSGVVVPAGLAVLLIPVVLPAVVYGPAVVRIVVAVMPLMLLAAPAWDSLGPSFQQLTVAATRALIAVTQLPATVDGVDVTLQSGVFRIAEDCNGLQIFLAGVATGGVFSALQEQSPRQTALIVCGAALLSLLANWVRVYTVVLAGHLSDMQHYLVRSEHYSLGWTLFAVSMLVYLMYLGKRVRSAPGAEEPTARPAAAAVARRALLGFVAVAVWPAWAFLPSKPDGAAPAAMPQIPGWAQTREPSAWRLEPAALQQQAVELTDGRQRVSLYRGAEVGRGRVARLPSLASLPSADPWTVVATQSDAPVHTALVTDGTGRTWRVGWTYWSNGAAAGAARNAQLRCGMARLLGESARCVVLAAAALCVPSCESAERAVATVLTDALAREGEP